MARKVRVQYPDAVYHVMSRGNQGNPIFQDDRDRERFLETLGEACGKTGWRIHAYVLMGNHYHLLLETPEANLVVGMKWLQGIYTGRFSRRHRVFGHLLAGRYKAVIVNGADEAYFGTVSTYIHLNPVRSGLVRVGEQRVREYRWSSYPAYVGIGSGRPEWLRVDRVLGARALERMTGRRGAVMKRMWRAGRWKVGRGPGGGSWNRNGARCGAAGIWEDGVLRRS